MAESQDDDCNLKDREEKAVREFSETLTTKSISCAIERIQAYLQEIQQVKLNIGMTGESGTGISTFVNALRGLGDDEPLSAPIGAVQTTTEPTPYAHPRFPNVVLWDLPGIGTPDFKPEEYLTKVTFKRYDFFIVISSERFRISYVDLAKHIQGRQSNFYFVRTKIDESIRAERRRKCFDKIKVLDEIRQDCINGLIECGITSPLVFLISSHELGSYDFNFLEKTMEREMAEHKRPMPLLALPNVALRIHQKKRETLQKRIWVKALLSAGAAAVPIPGLSICADVGLLMTEIKFYYQTFGLDDSSLENLSRQTGVPIDEFKAYLKSPINKEITYDVIVKMLTKVAGAGMMVGAHFANMLPLLGSLPAGALSFASTKHMLETCLKELADDAQCVLEKALKSLASPTD